MCALFPPYFPSFGWPLDNHGEQDYMYRDSEESPESMEAVTQLPPPTQATDHHQFDRSASFSANSHVGIPTTVKKLYHNASERDRRKKINTLYSSLRSLLPSADQTKKLSIPATVSRVLKYIPELQQTVERLLQKKEELLPKVAKQAGDVMSRQQQRKPTKKGSSSASVSATRLSDMELLIQISSYKVHDRWPLLSDILLNFEEDGLLLLNAYSFESFQGRVFYSLHVQMERTCGILDCEVLSEKLQSFYNEKKQELFPSNFGF